MSEFSKRLKELRTEAGYTQSDLAERINIHKQTISQYERGVRHPDFDTLSALCDTFNVSTDYLLGKDDVTMRLLNTEEMTLIDRLRRGDVAVKIPVFAKVPAGIPMEAIEDVVDQEEIPIAMVRDGGQYYGVRISGDSMEPRIKDGDVVIVRKQTTADSGDTVIAMVNGYDATCKRLKKYRDGIELIANNPSYETMFFSNDDIKNLPVQIIGKVVELRGKF